MRWLLHGPMSSAVADALRARGDSVVDPSSVGVVEGRPHADVLKAATTAQLDLMTSDAKLAELPFAPEAPRLA